MNCNYDIDWLNRTNLVCRWKVNSPTKLFYQLYLVFGGNYLLLIDLGVGFNFLTNFGEIK